MASTSISQIDSTTFSWIVGNLGSTFNQTHYIQVAIFNVPFTNGQSTTPSGLIDSYPAPATGSTFSNPPQQVSGAISPGHHYDFYGGAQTPSGDWFTAGSASLDTAPPPPPPPPRPANWSWSSQVIPGGDFTLYDWDWGDFVLHIDRFRTYKSLSGYSWFWNASTFTGDLFYAQRYNECLSAMSALNPGWWFASNVFSGDDVYAQNLFDIRDTLNSVS